MFVARRMVIKALAHLLCRERFGFDGGTFTVSPGVLNPTLFRASLVFAREALDVAGTEAIHILELGCGSGLASVALARRGHVITAVDRCLRATINTAENAENNGIALRTVCSDWDTALAADELFDLVVTNPPFLPSPAPLLNDALWGGTGLGVVEKALQAATRRLRPDGRALLMTSVRSGREAVERAILVSGLTPISNRVVRHWGEKLHFDLLACRS